MFSIANETAGPAQPAEQRDRRLSIAHGAAVVIVALLTIAAYVTLERAIAVQSESATAMNAAAQRVLVTSARDTGASLTLENFEQADAAARRTVQARIDGQLAVLRAIGLTIGGSVLATLLGASLLVFRPMARSIARLTHDALELARVATTDPLTGMLNRHSFQARGAIEIQKARRYGRPLSMLMIDADQLPAIEGAHGLTGGQTVLKALTSSFFAGTRVSDLLARVDAEQFAILLPETDGAGAEILAERLRTKIGNLSVLIGDKFVSSTLSIGVAVAEKDASFLWPTFKRADEALYEAKIRGRNRVVVATAA
jgi:diguanylate cyclase (GGDEF)-like protein